MVLNSDVRRRRGIGTAIQLKIALVKYALTKTKQELEKISKSSRISIRFVKKMHDDNTSNRKEYWLPKGCRCTVRKIVIDQNPGF
jgi:hypothetical protein